jgi:2-polyprenyl-3-methyl-5-hydroxy-6-metoxy-1,4-benzoquinol methylase
VSLARQYNEWHSRVFEAGPEHSDEGSPWYRLLLEYLLPVQGKRVLEVACGRGGFAKLLASRGAVVSGADFSETALRIAWKRHRREQHGYLDLTQADAEKLPYADGSFDTIISCETIEHLPDPLSALREMARVCRPGGFLYLTTPNYFNAMGLYYVYARLRGRRATPGSDQPFDRVFLFPQIRRMLRRAGWVIVRSDGTVHQFPIKRGHDPVAVPALESSRTIRCILSPIAFHYFVIAEKSSSFE